jgi:hypothetical protein
MSFTIMAGIATDGAVELVFQCNRCQENVPAVRSGPGAAHLVKLGEGLHVGGVRPENAVAAAGYLAHECDPARVILSLART